MTTEILYAKNRAEIITQMKSYYIKHGMYPYCRYATNSHLVELVADCTYNSTDGYRFNIIPTSERYIDIAIFYTTQDTDDKLLITRGGRKYGVHSLAMYDLNVSVYNANQIDSSLRKKYSYVTRRGFATNYNESTESDLTKALNNESIIIYTEMSRPWYRTDHPTNIEPCDYNPNIRKAQSISYGSWIPTTYNTYDPFTSCDPDFMYTIFNSDSLQVARNYWIQTIRNFFTDYISFLNVFLTNMNSYPVYSSTDLKFNNFMYEKLVYWFNIGSTDYYKIRYNEEKEKYESRITSIDYYMLYRPFHVFYNSIVESIDYIIENIFPKLSSKEAIQFITNDLCRYKNGEYVLTLNDIDGEMSDSYINSFLTCGNTTEYTFYTRFILLKNAKIYYSPFDINQTDKLKTYVNTPFTVSFKGISTMNNLIQEIEKHIDTDDFVMFAPEILIETDFSTKGYNIQLTSEEEESNLLITYGFDEIYRTTNYQFINGNTNQVVPWYFVRSSDYTDWINKFNENRNTTTAYRKTESGSDTTIYFKDSEIGMTGAIEASNYFKTLFEDTSYLQNDDLDGIGEICSSILAVEKDFYESLNENSESTVDFKNYNTYYIELLENKVDELHLLITEQEEMTNDIRTKFSEILDLIHTFYTNELPLPKEPVTPEDILKSQIDIFDKKNILSIFN